MLNYQHVIEFWFHEIPKELWFQKNDDLDLKIKKHFAHYIEAAARGELFFWRTLPEGRLAEIIVLDQFSRNAYRGSAEAFENDGMALILAQEMVQLGLDKKIFHEWRAFIYMPYMHSESPVIHREAMELFQENNLPDNLRYEVMHKEVIDRFGRFPHRNQILGRATTTEEIVYLSDHPGF